MKPANHPNCIITGCNLIFAGSNSWQHGDLWEVGETYIFNAVGELHGYPYPSILEHCSIVLAESSHHNYFERRNVYVFAKAVAVLVGCAVEYVAKGRTL